jgi:hypothetical protein
MEAVLAGARSTLPFLPTRPQDPIVLVLSPLWRTVLVIERVACKASMRLPLRLTNPSLLADHAPYLHSLIHYQISARASR